MDPVSIPEFIVITEIRQHVCLVKEGIGIGMAGEAQCITLVGGLIEADLINRNVHWIVIIITDTTGNAL